MSTKSSQKNAAARILRIGVIQNGRIIEERLVRERVPVTVGTGLKNTIVLATAGIPTSHTLFDLEKGQYRLVFTEGTRGRIKTEGALAELGALQAAGRTTPVKGGHAVVLDEDGRGKIVLGDVTLLFQFVDAPRLRALPVLPASMRGGLGYFLGNIAGLSGVFLVALLLSFFLQVGFILFLKFFVPPPPRGSGEFALNERWIRMLEQEEQEEAEPVEVEIDPDGTEIVETDEVAEEVQVANDDSSRSEPAPQRTRDEIRASAATNVRERSALSALLDSTSGVNLGIATSDEMSAQRAQDAIASASIRGSGDGIISDRGMGTSAGAEGQVGREGIGGGGGQVSGAAVATRTEDREGARVSGSIRGSREQTAGSGSLDQSELQRRLRRYERDITRCYERGLAQNPNLRGRLMIEFRIDQNGQVSDARLPTNETNSEVGNCVTGAIRRWRFPAPEGGVVVVRKAYILEPGG